MDNLTLKEFLSSDFYLEYCLENCNDIFSVTPLDSYHLKLDAIDKATKDYYLSPSNAELLIHAVQEKYGHVLNRPVKAYSY